MGDLVLGLTLLGVVLAWRRARARDAVARRPHGASDDVAHCWRPPGRTTTIYGHRLRDGMVYVGRGLPAVAWNGREPALIDPGLPIAHGALDREGRGLGRWPSYADLPAASRAAYLAWLAAGRRDPGAGVAYARLFLYGIERRVLHDARVLPLADAERDALAAEVDALLSVYGRHDDFREQARTLLRCLHGTGSAPDPTGPPPVAGRDRGCDLALRRGLSELARRGVELPGSWALAWVRSRSPRAVAACPASQAFDALFLRRYGQRHGAGLVLGSACRTEAFTDRPASPTFAGQALTLAVTVPDDAVLAGPLRTLRALADECRRELGPYVRWIRRHPDGGALSALAWLPAEIVADVGAAELLALDRRLEQVLDIRGLALVESTLLDPGLGAQEGAAQTRAAWRRLVALLGRRGWGVAADGSQPAWPARLVIFRPSAGKVGRNAALLRGDELTLTRTPLPFELLVPVPSASRAPTLQGDELTFLSTPLRLPVPGHRPSRPERAGAAAGSSRSSR